MQGLAFAGYLKHNGLPDLPPIKRCLIVCPATLKLQWQQEIEKFTDEKCIIIDGGTATSKKKAFHKRLEQYQQVKDDDIFYTIVNYELLRQKEKKGTEEVKKGKKMETKTVWGDYIDLTAILENEYDLIIVDEAQRLKNPETELYRCFMQIQNPKVRLLMTGTPIEKDLQNIFPLVDYLSPNVFSDERYDFATRWLMFRERFLIMGWNEYALKAARGNLKEEFREIKGVKNVGLLKKLVAPIMLRRKTEDVKGEMPSATESLKPVEWDKDQRDLYEMLQNELIAAREMMSQAIAKNQEEDAERAKNEMNAMLLYMLEVCNTPELLFRSYSLLAINKIAKIKKYEDFAKKAGSLIRTYRKLNEQFGDLRKEAQLINKKAKEEELTPALKSSLQTRMGEIKKEVATIQKQVKEITDAHDQLVSKVKFKSPKLEGLVELVENITVENEQKIVIFSKFEKMTQILQREIDKQINKTSNGKRKKEQIGITMYTGATEKGCMWLSQLQKEGKSTQGLACNQCPFQEKCNSRTKSAWFFQNDPDTRVLIATDAGNAGVNLQAGRYLVNYDLPDSYAIYA